ncbi:MAG TPA: hypothetical protein VGW76_13100 [Pyrinomonadaceae bacterium]|nr:hypothetical protein [Pyrinomonadaceae bacterium]
MIRSIALALILLLPDRLPSLVLLVSFWIPPAVVGFAVADLVHRGTRVRAAFIYIVLAIFAVCWSAAWFLFQLDRIPPYVPGATMDPTYAPPEAVVGLAVVASALVLPVSVIACLLTFRIRARMLSRTSARVSV